ncbi:hypothetical protein A9Q83_04800 [Alphaproteobacteria bacterium 46_93_T64]|nr:hypothetical protein A9Q83_04800 [Alphaproteobacteria bacterium 46_93_T64]
MDTVIQSVTLNTSKEEAWKVLADFGNAHKYFKGIQNAYLMTEQQSGVGTIRHCDLPSMMGMKQFIDEEITDWVEGEEFTYIVTNTAAPIKDGIARWRVEGDALHATIHVDIRYQAKGLMGHMMRSMLRKEFNKQIAVGLNDIKELLESRGKIAA